MKSCIIVLLFLILINTSNTQQLVKKMRLDTLYQSTKINPEGDKAYLHVQTQIVNLRFSSNLSIAKSNQISNGGWDLWLPAGTHILKIDAEGYQRLELEPTNFGQSRSYELVISALGNALTPSVDQDVTEVVFLVDQDSVFSSYGDNTPIMSHSRRISYKLPKGEYKVRFLKKGYAEQTKTVRFNQPQELTIALEPDPTKKESDLKLPGFLVIESEPRGADIFLNGQWLGITPYQGEITPGRHHLELSRPLYYPDVSSLTLEEGKTFTIKRNLKPRFGWISIKVNPPEAVVSLDGKQLGLAPFTHREIESARHTLRVEAPLYHPRMEEFSIEDNQEKNFDVSLMPAFGSMTVNTVPEEGAEVYFDGVKVGNSPYSQERQASGRYILKVSKDLCRDVEEEIEVTDGQPTRKIITLNKSFGSLTIVAPSCRIFVNDHPVGSDRYTGRMDPGNYRLRSERYGPYKPADTTLQLSVGECREITLEPTGRFGRLIVVVDPFEARDAEILVNNELRGNAPLAIKLLMGNYSVTAKKNGYLNVAKSVTLAENEQAKLNLRLLTYDVARQAEKHAWGRWKWISLGASGVAGGAAVIFKLAADRNYDRYQNATSVLQAVNFKDNVNQNNLYYKIALGVAGGLLSSAVVSWIVQMAR